MAEKSEKKNVEVKVMGAKLRDSYPPPFPTHRPTVNIEEIKNGYVIKSCCGDQEDAEFTKNLSSAPSIIARLFDVGNKSAAQIEEMTSSKIKDA